MSAFHEQRIFSSRAGHTRKLRAFKSFEREDSIRVATACTESPSAPAMSSSDAWVCKCHAPSKLALRSKPNRAEKALYSRGVSNDCTSLRCHA